MPSNEDICSAVAHYLATVASGTAEDIAACYAEDATLEDPVGSEVRSGRAAIREFYSAIEGVQRDTELLDIRVAGDRAAFRFRVTTVLPAQTVEIEPIDVMTFDSGGRITAMQAFWSQEDVRVSSSGASN